MNRDDRRFNGFDRDVAAARLARGGNSQPQPQSPDGTFGDDAWKEMARGGNLGKSVPIRFVGAGFGTGVVTVPNAEILRLHPRTDRPDLVTQLCLTVSPPQVIDLNIAPNPAEPSIQGQDALDLSVVQSGNPTGGYPANLSTAVQFANSLVKVEWGIGAIKNSAFIDCGNGLTVNLVTSWLIVTAFIEQPIGVTPTPELYIIGANVGPGDARQHSSQRTIQVGNVANAGQSASFVIPRFARNVRVAGADGGAAPALAVGTIQFWGDAAMTLPIGDFAFNANQTNPIPVPGGAYFFSIIGGYAGTNIASPRYAAIFDLNL